tara:strand:- start:1103 stop:1369 length:267 start_codon:yes stop_codon:yes gene_type:complete
MNMNDTSSTMDDFSNTVYGEDLVKDEYWTVKKLEQAIEERRQEVIKKLDIFINEDLTEDMAIQAITNIVNRFGFNLEDLKTKILVKSI